MLANRALVYSNQDGKYCADGCMALGSNSSVVNDPLGEPGCTPLYVGLLSTWGSGDGDHVCFPHISWEGSLTGDSGSQAFLSIGAPLGDHRPGGGLLSRGLGEEVRFCFIRRPCLLGTPGDV